MGARATTLILALAATIAALGLTACSGGGGGQGSQGAGGASPQADLGPLPDVTDPSSAAKARAPAKPSGPAISVTWEALSREKYLLENSRFKRRGGPQPPQLITLFSESHPEARKVRQARTKEDRQKYAGSAVLSDKDMARFVEGLRRQGFYRYARPSGYDDALADSENARGRIIVEEGGQSRTLLSMRGQGQHKATKAIPKLYSETKQAVMYLRNMTPTLNVQHYDVSGSAR